MRFIGSFLLLFVLINASPKVSFASEDPSEPRITRYLKGAAKALSGWLGRISGNEQSEPETTRLQKPFSPSSSSSDCGEMLPGKLKISDQATINFDSAEAGGSKTLLSALPEDVLAKPRLRKGRTGSQRGVAHVAFKPMSSSSDSLAPVELTRSMAIAKKEERASWRYEKGKDRRNFQMIVPASLEDLRRKCGEARTNGKYPELAWSSIAHFNLSEPHLLTSANLFVSPKEELWTTETLTSTLERIRDLGASATLSMHALKNITLGRIARDLLRDARIQISPPDGPDGNNRWSAETLLWEIRKVRSLGAWPALIGEDLSGLDLTKEGIDKDLFMGADLRRVNAKGLKVSGLDLSHVDLEGADLSNAKLDGANLTGANLYQARFKETDFSHSKLTRVYFGNTDVENSDFSFANFELAFLQDTDFKDCLFDYATFNNIEAGRVVFRGFSSMRFAQFTGDETVLDESKFLGPKKFPVSGTFKKAAESLQKLKRTRKFIDLTGAHFRDVSLYSSTFEGVRFRRPVPKEIHLDIADEEAKAEEQDNRSNEPTFVNCNMVQVHFVRSLLQKIIFRTENAELMTQMYFQTCYFDRTELVMRESKLKTISADAVLDPEREGDPSVFNDCKGFELIEQKARKK